MPACPDSQWSRRDGESIGMDGNDEALSMRGECFTLLVIWKVVSRKCRNGTRTTSRGPDICRGHRFQSITTPNEEDRLDPTDLTRLLAI